jgi:hypothetical protein
MVQSGRASIGMLVMGAALAGGGAARAEPLLGQDLQLSDSAGLFPTILIRPNTDNFSYTWGTNQPQQNKLKIDITQTPGVDTWARITVSSLSNFTFPTPDIVKILDVHDTIAPLTQEVIHDIRNLNLGLPDPTILTFAQGSSPLSFTLDLSGKAVTTTSSVQADLTFAASAPEPGTLALFGLGLAGLASCAAWWGRRPFPGEHTASAP